jgi:hypothetical protein
MDSSTSLQVIFHNLRDNYSPELSIQDICKWSSMTGNSAILTPLVLLQLKLKKFIIGEKYWTTKTAERQSDEEMKKVEYIRKFQTIVKSKITAFKQRKDLEAKEKELNAKKSMGRAEANIARKQSLLMESFQLKKSPSKVAVSSPIPEEAPDETGKPVKDSSSKKSKPSRPQSASGERGNRPQSASAERKEESTKASGEKSLKREKSSRAEKSSKSSSKANLSSLDENVGTLEKQKSSRPESAKLEKKKSRREKKD